MAGRHWFAKLHLNKPQDFWNNLFYTREVEILNHYMYSTIFLNKKHHADKQNNITADVMDSGGGQMISACSHGIDSELLCKHDMQKNFRVKYEAICLTA